VSDPPPAASGARQAVPGPVLPPREVSLFAGCFLARSPPEQLAREFRFCLAELASGSTVPAVAKEPEMVDS
jgi:hypothetical protein